MRLEDEFKVNGQANSDKMTKQIVYLAVISAFISFGRAETCPRGPHDLPRFGPSCEYLCHCGQQECDRITGQCQSNLECDAGWMGSGCQYANIAFNTIVESNYLGNQSNIVDGNKLTCAEPRSVGDSIAYLTINFKREVKVREANIFFLNTVLPFNISILGGNGSKSLCGSMNDISGQTQFVVKCGRPLHGQHIQLTSYGPAARLVLCELQVPSGINMAYRKPAYQSSDSDGLAAYRAVDGDATLLAWQTCTHTTESTNPWWLLDLQTSVIIQWFRIYNRKDEPPNNVDLNERLRNFRILLSQDNVTFREFYQDNSTDTPLVIQPSLNPEVTTRFVKIDLRGDHRILTLCEVQVFGECSYSLYGNCSMPCGYCAGGKPCDMITGYCSEGGCANGWQTEKCDKSCDNDYYGNCTTKCGHCRNSTVCNKVNGSCKSGQCSEGWKGDKCDIECDSKHYGENCEHQCGHCVNETCNQVSGKCSLDAGCESGWQGSRCDIVCDNDYYGNCTTKCGHCRNSTACNKVNGSCPAGQCSEGWKGDKCDAVCDSKHYGDNCVHQCGHCLNITCNQGSGNCLVEAGCQPGWQGSRCDIGISNDAGTNTGIVVGAVCAAVGLVVIVVVIIVVMLKKRRKRNKHEADMQTVAIDAYYVNLAVDNADMSSKKTISTSTEKTHYAIEEPNLQRGVAVHVLSSNAEQKEPNITVHNEYEKLRAVTVAEESTYSTIEHRQEDDCSIGALENCTNYVETLQSLERELRSVDEERKVLLERKEKLLCKEVERARSRTLKDSMATKEYAHSMIEQSHIDDQGSDAVENCSNYVETLQSLEKELTSLEKKRNILLERKEELLRNELGRARAMVN